MGEGHAGAAGVDAKRVVYSLGWVLYEALSGQTPFVVDGTGRIIAMHLFQDPVSLQSIAPKVPTVVTELVHRLLVKDKRLRPNMSDTADDICRSFFLLLRKEHCYHAACVSLITTGIVEPESADTVRLFVVQKQP